jgi:hypothetical protein
MMSMSFGVYACLNLDYTCPVSGYPVAKLSLYLPSSIEFITTVTELVAIATPAKIGSHLNTFITQQVGCFLYSAKYHK